MIKYSSFNYKHVSPAGPSLSCPKPNLLTAKFANKPNHTMKNGTTLHMECKSGLIERNGESNRTDIHCYNGSWKGRIPVCDSTELLEFLRI